jgi:hypothetical protein
MSDERAGSGHHFRGMFDWLRHAIAAARVLVLPLGISLLALVVLAFPGQVLEYYRVLSSNLLTALLPNAGAVAWRTAADSAALVAESFAAVLLMAACLTYSSRLLLAERRESFPLAAPFWRGTYLWSPAVIGALPIAGVSLGIWWAGPPGTHFETAEGFLALSERATTPDFAGGVTILTHRAEIVGLSLRLAAAAALLCALAFALLAHRLSASRPNAVAPARATNLLSLGAAGVTTAGLTALFVLDKVVVPQILGAIVLLALFIICITTLATQLSILSHRIGIPLNHVLVICAIVFSLTDINDNHELTRVGRDGGKADATRIDALPSADKAFLDWYSRRPDRAEKAANGKYPVYIVAAQGGGIYAAAQTLLFLTRMQEFCERFSQHLFAISGVSGGSVGAALYTAFAQGYVTGKVDCASPLLDAPVASSPAHNAYLAAYQLLTADFLSPLVAGGLFPDFAQRFLPFPVPSWSRAPALEQALEAAWESAAARLGPAATAKGNPLKRGLVGSWDPGGAAPALLLNTTETGSGRRRVIAPFRFAESEDNDLRFLPASGDYDVPVSTAAVASARFPWLTPAAWFRDPVADGDVRRMVDGAYFENSGVATAMDLIDRLEAVANSEKLDVEFHLIAMTVSGFPEENHFLGLGELISPVMSLLNARSARTNTTVGLAERKLGVIDAAGKEDALPVRRLQKVELKNMLTPLPLGWRISLSTDFQILLQSGIVKHCHPNAAFEQTERFGSTADCVKPLIYHQLSGDDLRLVADTARKRF